MHNPTLAAARRWYAEDLRVTAPIRHTPRLVEAFAAVPREDFLGPGPWRVLPDGRFDAPYDSPDADPRILYHAVLIAIDGTRDLNNGSPRLWAYLFDVAELGPGARILQIGAGTGYYTAILAEVVGKTGQVIGVELDPALAARAAANVAAWPNATVIAADGTTYNPGPVDAVIAFAGATHPAPLWLDRLTEGGSLLMALTAEHHFGFMLHARRRGDAFTARSRGRVGIFNCAGARDAAAAKALQRKFARLRGPVPVRSLHRGTPDPRDCSVWYAGPGFWLSRKPLPES